MLLLLHAFLLFVAFGTIIIGLTIIKKRLQMFGIFYDKMKATATDAQGTTPLASKHTRPNTLYSADVSVIAPVRGLEEHTEENIMSMLQQDYKNKWEVIFVVDNDDKKTRKKIREIISKAKIKNTKIIHNTLFQGSGKSSALVAGVKHAKYPVIVSYDSDARVRDTWLADLVAPLNNKKVGVSTGFRFYVPDSFVSYVLSVWNCVGYIAVQRSQPFAWGGGFAIKKDLIKKLGLLDIWKKVISDDTAVARKIEQAKMKSYFVPSCIALSYHSKFSRLTEFTTRQMAIIRWNWPSAYKTSVIMFGGSRVSIILGIIMLGAYAITGTILFLIEAVLLLFIILIELVIANIDFKNFAKVLGIEIGSRFKWSVAYLLGHWLMAYNILLASRKKTITWRGREYDFKKEAQMIEDFE